MDELVAWMESTRSAEAAILKALSPLGVKDITLHRDDRGWLVIRCWQPRSGELRAPREADSIHLAPTEAVPCSDGI